MSKPPNPGVYVSEKPQASSGGGHRHRVLFLDRDGVININHGYVCTPDRTDWVPGIFELGTVARKTGYVLVVATNQAGIARGYYSEADFLEYTRWMHREFAARGLDILATLYCPHHPTAGLGPLRTECSCRKPAPGMFQVARDRFDLGLDMSVMVGDKESDLVAASTAGVGRGFLVDPYSASPFDAVVKHLRQDS